MTRQATDEMTWGSEYHAPVLAREVARLLEGARDILDGTLGGGGHSLALLEHGAHVVGVDRDPAALREANARLASFIAQGRFRAFASNYASIDQLPELAERRFDGVLLDLGVSSHQLNDESRGFTFRPGAVLDMRMGQGAAMSDRAPRTGAQGAWATSGGGQIGEAEGQHDGSPSAADFLNTAPEHEIVWVMREYGDERRAHRLAKEITRRRETRPFVTSDDLVGAIRGALGASSGPPDFARIFQAVRIAVNDELAGLERALPALRERLVPGGMMVVIAYHSGEDRVVKHAFRDWSTACICPPKQPVCTCRGSALGTLMTKRAVVAGDDEVAANPRARSARLRAWRSTWPSAA